jgi:hypothetical protein
VEKDTLYPERSMHYLGRLYARAWKSFFEMLVRRESGNPGDRS